MSNNVTLLDWFPGWGGKNIPSMQNQPSDDGFSNEDCVEIRRMFYNPKQGVGHTSSFFWNDRNCEEKNPFICQHDKRICKYSIRSKVLVAQGG